MEKPPRDLGDRILDYSTRIVKVVGSMPKTLAGRRVADQLLTSGLSVGANFEEAQAAESRNDFVHKLQIGAPRIWLLAPGDFARRTSATQENGSLTRRVSSTYPNAVQGCGASERQSSR